MIEVVPAIIPESLGQIYDEASRVKDYVHRVQIDIMDGDFAPTTSWPFLGLESRSELQDFIDDERRLIEDVEFEIDMMIQDPQYFIDDWIRVGAKALIIHLDSTDSLEDIISKARNNGVSIGVAFKPSYAPENLDEYIKDISSIQIMGNDKIGYHGVELDEEVYEIAKRFREMYPHVTISVDIGVNLDTAPRLVESGVNKLVSGSAIFDSTDVEQTISYFKNL